METLASWVAPAATMIAAMMTAANLGARVTGFGFVVFVVGSIGWSIVAISTGQQNLLWTNGFLTLVNAVGIWRWLGRQARYEDGGKSAAAKSAEGSTPTLVAFGALAGAKVVDADGEAVGSVIDGMMDCNGGRLAYLVVTTGGFGGVGERLFALARSEMSISADGVTCHMGAAAIAEQPSLEPGHWPAVLRRPDHSGGGRGD